MQKKYLSNFLSLVMLLLMWTACEKEAIQTSPREAIIVTELDQALNFLSGINTALPFALLEIDHKTNQVEGFFVDNKANLRKIDIKDASYLDMSEISLEGYFMQQLHLQSELIAELDPIEVVAHLKVASSLKVHANFTVTENTTTSKIFLSFTANLQGNNHNRDCVGGNRHSTGGTYSKILIAGSGQINYEAKTAQEKSLVQWLQSMEELADN